MSATREAVWFRWSDLRILLLIEAPRRKPGGFHQVFERTLNRSIIVDDRNQGVSYL
jgi:hypothetical protein